MIDEDTMWTDHRIIGWVPLDEDDIPYQPTLGSGWRSRTKPITVYATEARAKTYSPVGKCRQVRMSSFEEVE